MASVCEGGIMEFNQVKGEILNRWKDDFLRKVPETNYEEVESLAESLPSLIHELVSNPSSNEISELAKINTRHHLRRGSFPLEKLIVEYQVLKDVILDTLNKEATSIPIEVRERLPGSIVTAMLTVALEYSKVQTENKIRLEATLDHLPVGVVIMEKNSRNFLFINRAGHEMCGGLFPTDPKPLKARGDYATDSQGRLVTGEDLPMYRAARGEKLKAYEMTWHSPGKRLTLVMHSDFLPPMGPEPERVLVVFQEIQARKDREEYLLEERHLRERFVASLTHDLKTPLFVARMNIEMVKKISDKPLMQERCQKALIQIDNVERMVRDLLDITSLKVGRSLPIEKMSMNLTQTAQETLTNLASLYGERFKLKAPERIMGWWCPKCLKRILENLIINAVKYGYPNQPISVCLKENETEASLEVHNYGPPLKLGEKKEIFDPFTRTESSEKSSLPGWGMGLSIVKELVDAHQGRIEILSDEAAGTLFRILMPKNLNGDLE